MARKRIDRTDIMRDGPLPDHLHAHVENVYSSITRPDMVVSVVEFILFGGPNDGQILRIALCPHCMLKLAACTEALVEKYPEAFQE